MTGSGNALANGLGFYMLYLAPELWHVARNRCADDLAWSWMFLYVLGLGASTAYLIMVDALAGWSTMLIEIAMV